MKSLKSKIEINNTIESHITDGAALTKFLIWLKKNYKKRKVSEISAQQKLLAFRRKIEILNTLASQQFPVRS